jgi:hypothetical protein
MHPVPYLFTSKRQIALLWEMISTKQQKTLGYGDSHTHSHFDSSVDHDPKHYKFEILHSTKIYLIMITLSSSMGILELNDILLATLKTMGFIVVWSNVLQLHWEVIPTVFIF